MGLLVAFRGQGHILYRLIIRMLPVTIIPGRHDVWLDSRLSLGGDVSLVLLHGGDEVLADRNAVLEVEVVVDGSERK